MMNKEVVKAMTTCNKLGMRPDEFSIVELEEINKITEVYNSEESRLIDNMANAMLDLLALGEKAEAEASDAKDFACMIDDLCMAKTAEDYELTLSVYGNLGQIPAVQEYVAYKKAHIA